MRKLCRVNIRRSEEIFEKIKAYTECIIKALNPLAVILFGSFAKGDINEGSDVDIIVIANFSEPFLDRIRLLLDLNENIGLPLEPIGYTPEEFQKMRKNGNPFVEEVLKNCVVLYGTITNC